METLNESILDLGAPATEKPCGSAALLRDDHPAQPGSHSFQWLTKSMAYSHLFW
jgi:hypothetical protein